MRSIAGCAGRSRIGGEFEGGRVEKSDRMGGWRMTGSAEKCFSMNGGERCVVAIIIFRKGGGLGEGW